MGTGKNESHQGDQRRLQDPADVADDERRHKPEQARQGFWTVEPANGDARSEKHGCGKIVADWDESVWPWEEVEEVGSVEALEQIVVRSKGRFEGTTEGVESVRALCGGAVECDGVDAMSALSARVIFGERQSVPPLPR
jgi:hypothetical protein